MSKKQELVFDNFTLGQEIPVFTRTVTSEDIDEFCETWGEDNPVYLNDAAARKLGFAGRVAPPMMVRNYAHLQNVLTGLNGVIPAHSIHAEGKYVFAKPVSPGDTISTTGTVINKYVKKGRKYVSFRFTSVDQNGELVVVNEHTSVWPR